MDRKTNIQEFYRDKVVLLTGGTGLIGKLLLEKLLRTCPEVKTLYLLVRDKPNCSAQNRISRMLKDQMFQSMIEKCPNYKDKIQPIRSDLSESGIDLNSDDRVNILDQVNVIFHCAATIRFDEELKLAVAINMVGTKNLCELALGMRKLESMVHVSTAYSHCQHSYIEEKVYCYDTSPEEIISLVTNADSKSVNRITAQLLGQQPNTYVYTKSLSEVIVNKFAVSLPIAIFRPAIITATNAEPQPGWLDGKRTGCTAVVAAIYIGLLKTLACTPDATANIVPADMTVNAIVALGYCVGTELKKELLMPSTDSSNPTAPVVNYVIPECNRLSWHDFKHYVLHFIRMFPLNTLVWYPFLCFPTSNIIARIQEFLLHYLPALLLNIFCGKKQYRIVKLFTNLPKINRLLCYFTTRTWRYQDRNMRTLWKILEDEDKDLFPFNLDSIHWPSYVLCYVQGTRKYILGDDPKTLPTARKKLLRWYYIHQLAKVFLIIFVIGACLCLTAIIS